jgi:hypothetical protein
MHSTTALLMTVHEAVHRCVIGHERSESSPRRRSIHPGSHTIHLAPQKGSQGQPEGLLKMHPSRSWKSGVATTEGGLAPCALPDTRSRI